MGVNGQRHALTALPLGKTLYPLYRRLGGPQGWSGQVQKIMPPLGFDPRTAQPVASCYANWAILALFIVRTFSIIDVSLYSCLSFPVCKTHIFCTVSYWRLCLYHIFPHYLINGIILGKKFIEHKMCVLILSADLFETILILRRIQWDFTINLCRSLCKVPSILVWFLSD